MSLSYKQGSFTLNTVTGNQTIDSGSGVQGKVLLLWATRQTAAGFSASESACFGVALSSSSRACVCWASDDNVATSNDAKGLSATRCLRLFSNGTPTTDIEVDFVSFGSGGTAGQFTINVAQATTATAVIVHYIILGGDSLTNVALVQKTQATGTGSAATTGVGFKGDAALFFGAALTTLTDAAGVAAFMGAAVSSSKRGYSSWSNVDATTMTGNTKHAHSGADCIGLLSGTTLDSEADFVSFDTDGYTLNWTNAAGSAWIYFALVMKGPIFDVQQISAPAGTGNQSYTAGFQPSGVFLFGSGQTTADSTVGAEEHIAIGATDGSAENSIWSSADDTINTDSNMRNVTTKAIAVATNPSTVAAEADGVSMDSTGYTLNWTTTASGRKFIGLAIGNPFKITGITKDSAGVALGSCTVNLLKDLGGSLSFVAQTTSDGSGNYTFGSMKDNAASYIVVAWKDGSPHVFDCTDHVLQPVSE